MFINKMKEIIYCIMVTGKDMQRYKFANISITNFKRQTYENKKLIILNHGDQDIIHENNSDIIEIKINKEHFTLGDIRNFGLNLVPLNSLWITWDDDDWRSDNFLKILYSHLKDNDVVFIKNRLEYNLNNKFIFKSHFSNGMPFFLSRKIEIIEYLSKDSLEDIQMYDEYSNNDFKIKIIDNDPRMYIRIIHTNNSSLYVEQEKNNITLYSDDSKYTETNPGEEEIKYCFNIIKKYFIIK